MHSRLHGTAVESPGSILQNPEGLFEVRASALREFKHPAFHGHGSLRFSFSFRLGCCLRSILSFLSAISICNVCIWYFRHQNCARVLLRGSFIANIAKSSASHTSLLRFAQGFIQSTCPYAFCNTLRYIPGGYVTLPWRQKPAQGLMYCRIRCLTCLRTPICTGLRSTCPYAFCNKLLYFPLRTAKAARLTRKQLTRSSRPLHGKRTR